MHVKQKKQPLKQTAALLIVECPDSTQICQEFKQRVLKSTCKAFKEETRSYCLSALAMLWRIACTGTVLCCGRSLC